MTIPTYAPIADPRVAALVLWLTADERFDFEESAGIRQHDGLLSQGDAECQALLDILAQRKTPPMPRIFRLTLQDNASQWVLANDLTQPLAHLHELGGIDITEETPAAVLAEQFGGLAFLATTA